MSGIDGIASTRVKFGVVGCGHIGARSDAKASEWIDGHLWIPYSHAGAICAVPEAQLVAVCDVDEEKAVWARKTFGAARHYADYQEMLEAEHLDAVSIATRTAERPAIIRHCAERGIKGIYCEKPLCNELEVADELARLLQEREIAFVYGTKRRYMPVYREVKDRVWANEIGQLRTILIRFCKCELLWTHPHTVDLAAFFADDAEVEHVQADLDLDPGCIDVSGRLVDADPKVHLACITFRSGVRACIVGAEGYDVELYGTDGMLGVQGNGRSIQWRKDPRPGLDSGLLLLEGRCPTTDRTSATVMSISSLCRAVLEKSHPGYDVKRAVRNMEVLFGFLESHLAGGTRVCFPLPRCGRVISGRKGQLYP